MFVVQVNVFYKNIQICILNNEPERGVRQRDLLSPYLFVTAVEIVAIAIRQNSDIKGIYIGEEQETKLLQYADDTTVILADPNSAGVLLDRF